MAGIFYKIAEMSINASWLILAVIVIRLLLGKAPKGFRYVLWALVAVRLMIPFSFESTWSLVPDMESVVSDDILQEEVTGGLDDVKNDTIISSPGVDPGETDDNDVLQQGTAIIIPEDGVLQENTGTEILKPQNEINMLTSVLPWIWIAGEVLFLLYMVISYLYLWKKVRASVSIGEKIYICDEICSPFIFGFFRPRIFLPSYVEKEQIACIVAHEKEHLKYFDYVWKPLGYIILALHWFNPLVWVAYILMCRDIELACDERVIRHMSTAEKVYYSEVLLACSSPRHNMLVYPVTFGEVGIKERIKKILLYKKPAAWIIGIAVVICVVVGICFLTDPVSTDSAKDTEQEDNTFSESEEETSEREYEEIIIYETTADLTHDGLKDKIQTVLYSHDGDMELESGRNSMRLRVFQGRKDGGFEQEASYVSEEYSRSHASNGTFILTEKEGKDYLMFSNMYEHQGKAVYEYSVMYVGKEMQTVIAEKNRGQFVLTEFSDLWEWYGTLTREEVVPKFRNQMEPWIEKGTILFALDSMTPVYASTKEQLYPADIYYDQVWSRSDDVVFTADTSYKTAYWHVINFLLERYGENSDKLMFSLINFDGDDTPELIAGILGRDTSMYTYDQGRVYPLMKQWAYGAGGNAGYLYIPGENVLFNENGDFSGAINSISFWKMDENHQFRNYYNETLKIMYFDDKDGNGAPSEEEIDNQAHYFYGEQEITKEEFASYLVCGDSLTELYGNYISLCPEKTLDAIRKELQ